MNPYHTLGVPPNASADTIKRFHRAAVKIHHPDKGGDEEVFARIQLAYDVLSNPARRERFDTTGQIDVPPPNAEEQMLFQLVATITQQLIEKDDIDLANMDVRSFVINQLAATTAETKKNVHALEEKVRRARQLQRRFKSRSKALMVDPIQSSLQTHERNLMSFLGKTKATLATYERARELFERSTYIIDVQQMVQIFSGQSSSTTAGVSNHVYLR